MVVKKAKKRLTETPKGKIVAILRRLFMWSPERAEALRRDNVTCQVCGKKRSVAKGKEVKVECHHIEGEVDWDRIVRVIRAELLCPSKDLLTLCKDCHLEVHKTGEL